MPEMLLLPHVITFEASSHASDLVRMSAQFPTTRERFLRSQNIVQCKLLPTYIPS